MASTSTSTTLNTPTSSCYEVFLNHRGPDTKKTFASHLYRRLVLHGFRVFWDKEEMQEGDPLTSQIEAAIQTAFVHVAIFSPKYAESEWCMNELHLMVESRRPIIPVFYQVQPTDVRHTHSKGVYAESLRNLGQKRTHDSQHPRYDATTIKKWRDAFSTVAEISGLDLEAFNGDEGELLEKVVESVSEKLKKSRIHVAEYPSGLDQKIKDFENKVLLQQQNGKPQVIGIVGLGGIGKTTLVKELFNRKSSNYHKSCFLGDVREHARKSSLESLQEELFKTLGLGIDVIGTDSGMLRNCHALVILDDVDNKDQLDALLRPIRDLHPKSLILITSRDKAVLTTSRVEESSIYKLTGLNSQHSKELFCLHAFNRCHPYPEFENLVDEYLKACDGLPLSLKLFGSLLYGNLDKSFWEDHLEQLQEILPQDIKKRFEISYTALQRNEKRIFLDIACFFIGEDMDEAIKIWDGSGWRGSLGFRSLQNKSLVEVDIASSTIRMHDHLRDLGRDLAKDPGLPRRIWRREDLDDLLQQSSAVTEVRGISMGRTEYDVPSFSGCKMKNLQLLDIEGDLLESILSVVDSPKIIWLRFRYCYQPSLPSWIPLNNLRVLEVNTKGILEGLWQEHQAPLELRKLKICSASYDIPKSIGLLKHLESIVVKAPTCFKDFRQLSEGSSVKNLEIYKSPMRPVPHSFESLTNLQRIELYGLKNLERLPDSFGRLTRLKYLDLVACHNLIMAPETFGNICTLEYLCVRHCPRIEVLPSQLAHQRSLETLELRGINIKELPSYIGDLSNLRTLLLGSLKLKCWPNSIAGLCRLTKLSLVDCEDLVEIKALPDAVETLTLAWCPKLRKVKGLCGLAKLRSLYIVQCTEVELPSMATLASLEALQVYGVRTVRTIRGLARLTRLRSIDVCNCSALKEMVGVEHLKSLENFYVVGCPNLEMEEGTISI